MPKHGICCSTLAWMLTFMILGAGGCVKRVNVTPYEKERVDQTADQGNRGYVQGHLPPTGKTMAPTTREMYEVKVDVPAPAKKPAKKTAALPAKSAKTGAAHRIVLPKEEASSAKKTHAESNSGSKNLPKRKSAPGDAIYVVQKGDTMEKISQKLFGTPRKWKLIFDLNREVVKNPNKLYPGQKIKIPPK